MSAQRKQEIDGFMVSLHEIIADGWSPSARNYDMLDRIRALCDGHPILNFTLDDESKRKNVEEVFAQGVFLGALAGRDLYEAGQRR